MSRVSGTSGIYAREDVRRTLDQLRAEQEALLSQSRTLKGKNSPDARRQAKTITERFVEVTRLINEMEREP